MNRFAALLGLSLFASLPAYAETILSEASGNWAGASGQGFSFLARLTEEEDFARLRIWSGSADAPPTGEGDPELDNGQISLAAFASLQALEVVETEQGAVLHIITEFADEYAEGRTVLQIRFIDNQYTVVGYHYQEVAHDQGDGPVPYECNIDFADGSMTEDGMEFALSVDDGMTNASSWTFSVVFDRGICSVN